MRRLLLTLASAAALAATPATAATITNGTVSSAFLFAPAISLSNSTSSYSVLQGGTFQVVSAGGLSSASGLSGTINGSIQFSKTAGTAIDQVLTNLFVFGDGAGGQFDFSAFRAVTTAFVQNVGISTSGSLVLYGFTSNAVRGLDPTASTLTITFNSTGGSSYSSSATLATISAVPEPATWAMMLLGMSLVATTARYRRRSAVIRFT